MSIINAFLLFLIIIGLLYLLKTIQENSKSRNTNSQKEVKEDQDPFSKMEEYYKIHKEKLNRIGKARDKITKAKTNLETKMSGIEKEMNKFGKLGEEALKRGNKEFAEQASITFTANKHLLESLIIQLEELNRNKQYLEDLYSGYNSIVKGIRFNIDIEKQKYDILKEVHEANECASEFSDDLGEQKMLYKTQIKQLEEATTMFTVKIEEFQKKATPMLEQIKFENSLQKEEGLKLIENYSSRLKQLQEV